MPGDTKSPSGKRQGHKPKSTGIKKQNTTLAYKTSGAAKQNSNINNSTVTVAKPIQPNPIEKKHLHKKNLTEADEDLIKAYKVVVAKCKDP